MKTPEHNRPRRKPENWVYGQLELLMRQSRSLVARARAGDWADVTAGDAERQHGLRDLFRDADPDQLSQLSDDLRELAVLDAQLLELARDAREQSEEQLEKLRRGGEGQRAYRRFGT